MKNSTSNQVPKKPYLPPRVTPVVLEMEQPVLASSVVDQNSIIMSTSQEVQSVNFNDASSFDFNWE